MALDCRCGFAGLLPVGDIRSTGAAIATIPTWLVWNWLMPSISGLAVLTVFQSFGLLLLMSLLFGSKPRIDWSRDSVSSTDI
jgi:hypothetical protein